MLNEIIMLLNAISETKLSVKKLTIQNLFIFFQLVYKTIIFKTSSLVIKGINVTSNLRILGLKIFDGFGPNLNPCHF